MEIRLSGTASVVDKNNKTIMAIVFQYPNGYRPAVAGHHHHHVPENHLAAVTVADRNNNQTDNSAAAAVQVENTNNNNIAMVELDQRRSFLGQLVRELFSVFDLYAETPTTTTTRAPANNTSRTTRRFEMQDNQRQGGHHGGSSTRTNLPMLSRESSSSTLPDIVQCHRTTSFSFGLSFESRTTTTTTTTNSSSSASPIFSRNPSTSTLPPAPSAAAAAASSPFINQDAGEVLNPAEEYEGDEEGTEEESWTLELKLAIGPWAQVGRDLRRVADQLQLESSMRRTRTPRRRSTEVSLVMKVALPTVAVLGLGYAFLRRHL